MLSAIRRNKIFIAILEELNTNTKRWRLLGKGSFGYAYDMGDGRVCKITSSPYEAEIATRISKKKKKLRYLYYVNNVFYIKNSSKYKHLIITPKYKKLTEKQKIELYELFNFLDPPIHFNSIDQIRKLIKASLKDYYSAMYPLQSLEYLVERRIKTFKRFNVGGMLRDLRNVNKASAAGSEDIHYENILKDKNHYVLIDVVC